VGSVQVFPGAGRGARGARLDEAWRHSATPESGEAAVRPARLENFAAIRALQRAFGAPEWTLKQLESRLAAFPEGQLVVECGGATLAAASMLVVQWDDYALDQAWKGITGDGFFTTHDTRGRTLFCADLVMDNARRGLGAGRLMCQAVRRLCRRLNLRRVIAASRLPGYRSQSGAMTPEAYAKRVIWGDIAEPSLRLPMSQGFQYCGVIRDYLPEDAASCGHAALLVWLNPLYAPGEPPAGIQNERRKCA